MRRDGARRSRGSGKLTAPHDDGQARTWKSQAANRALQRCLRLIMLDSSIERARAAQLPRRQRDVFLFAYPSKWLCAKTRMTATRTVNLSITAV
jgi:hypothetical protein